VNGCLAQLYILSYFINQYCLSPRTWTATVADLGLLATDRRRHCTPDKWQRYCIIWATSISLMRSRHHVVTYTFGHASYSAKFLIVLLWNMLFKIFKTIATCGFLTALECTKFVFGRGSAPDPSFLRAGRPTSISLVRHRHRVVVALLVMLASAKFWSFFCKRCSSEYSKCLPPVAFSPRPPPYSTFTNVCLVFLTFLTVFFKFSTFFYIYAFGHVS